jgi:Icc-related predicted phosphoesterase
MNLLAFTDIHGDATGIRKIAREIAAADLVLLAGDLTQFGRAGDVQRIIEPFRYFNTNILAIPGNCDHPEVDAWLQQEGLSVHAQHVVRNGIAFVGMGGSLPCPGLGTPMEQKEVAFEETLTRVAAAIPDGLPMVLVSHQPPYGTACDLAGPDRHVGSKSVRAFIERHQPLICFTGHIHESQGTDQVGNTWVVNPGPFRQGGYACAVVNEGKVEGLEIRSAGK